MSEGTGFVTRPGMVVNEIKNLIKGRYTRGFPIIKEILQNANDGRATRLDFGVIRGLGNRVNHPLLKGDALFFLNNGSFSRSDQEAITWFAVDANAGDKSKIGKFGLGQKSVFHFCEAFFYIARSNVIPEGCGRLLNPWAPSTGIDPKRSDWTSLSTDDRTVLEEYIITQGLVPKESPKYFLLWVPLRQQASDERCILSNYYNAESIENQLPNDMAIKIGQLLPILRHLVEVHYWVQNRENSLEEKFQVSLQGVNEKRVARCNYPKSKTESGEEYPSPASQSLHGRVLIEPTNEQLQFAGEEKLLPASCFTSLINSNQVNRKDFWKALETSRWWPKRRSVDENGDEHDEPDKVMPHCAVLFSRQRVAKTRRAKLTIQWAVFLPLADQEDNNQVEYQKYEYDGEYDYTLLLHGYFFLDSGRRYIDALQDILADRLPSQPPLEESMKEEEMIRHWNRLLVTEGTLKLILPALKKFSETHNLQAREMQQLCTLLQRSSCFNENNRRHLCAEYQWVYKLHPAPNEQKWILLNQNIRVLSLPAKLPDWSVFSGLYTIAEQSSLTLTMSKCSNLRIERPDDNWTESEVMDVLQSLESSTILTNQNHLNYLLEFLKISKVIEQPAIQQQLSNLIRQGFQTHIQQLQQPELLTSLQKLIELIDPQQRFKLNEVQNNNQQAIRSILPELYKLELRCLIVYAPFELANKPSGNNLDDHTASQILRCLEELFQNPSEEYKEVCANLVKQVLEASSVTRVLSENPNITVFRGYNCKQKIWRLYSYNQLIEFHQKCILLSIDQRNTIPNLAQALQEAILDHEIVLIKSITANLVKGESRLDKIPKCDNQGCRTVLRKKPNLTSHSNRVNLVKELIKNG